MTKRGATRAGIALINLPSVAAARAWETPIGLLFIDGDHTEAGVQKDCDAWFEHVKPGGVIVFDDATDPKIGPIHVLQRLVDEGRAARIGGVGKVVALRKI